MPKKQQIVLVSSDQIILLYDVLPEGTIKRNGFIIGYNDEVTDAKFHKYKDHKERFDFQKEFIVFATNSSVLK